MGLEENEKCCYSIVARKKLTNFKVSDAIDFIDFLQNAKIVTLKYFHIRHFKKNKCSNFPYSA